jgi:hypothetical protein
LKWADLLLETEVVNGNRKVYETEAENPDWVQCEVIQIRKH